MGALTQILLLAEDKPAQAAPSDLLVYAPLIGIGLLAYFMLLRPQKREVAAREAMLNQLKKNDKVVTIGGIIGTVANISPDQQEVTLKVDDNTRIRFERRSIHRVITEVAESGKSAEAKS
jgi:preprotein translocase subunit YajC